MMTFENPKKLFAILFCMLTTNMVNAGILWERELALNANTNSSPLASCLNKDANGVIVTTVECPKGSFPIRGGDNILWEIDIDGNVTRISPKNTDESNVRTNAKPIGPGCAIASDSTGDLLTVGILDKQKCEKGQQIAVVSGPEKTEKVMSPRNSIEINSIKKMILLQDNKFVVVGDENSDGLLLRIDNQGRIIQKKLFDRGGRICLPALMR